MATKALTVTTKQIEAFAERLGDLAEGAIGERTVAALNDVIDRTYDLASDRINAGINLTDDYVRRKMSVQKATIKRPTAEIVATGGKPDNTPLRNYDAKMKLTASKVDPKRQGPRILPVRWGQKQKGVQVQVTRGSRKVVATAFMLPLKAGTVARGNGLGVFQRYGPGKNDVKHLYGPAVYQLFRHQLFGTPFVAEVEEDLGDALIRFAEEELQKAIS